MEQIIEILQNLRSDVDFEKATDLVTGNILDSVAITLLITMLEEEFDIEIGMEYMENSNFDSAEVIWKMVQELEGE